MAQTFAPSIQQTAIFNWMDHGNGSAIVEAVAGAGKTTTLIKMIGLTRGNVVFMAFNKKIVEEISARVDALELPDRNRITIGTVHSLGFAAVRKVYRKTKVDGSKIFNIIKELKLPYDMGGFVNAAVGMAKQIGFGALSSRIDDLTQWHDMVDHYGLESNLPGDGNVTLADAIAASIKVLRISNERCEQSVDFNDMIYIPVLRGLTMDQYDVIFMDEAQDTNIIRLAMVRMMLRPGGRFVAVGDRFQSIYAFSGADSKSLDRIGAEFNCDTLPLTITYRCPQSVVTKAQEYVPHIECGPGAPSGLVTDMTQEEFFKSWASTLNATDFILCRNTKPLVTLAYSLIGRNIGCRIEGRDIGMGLIKLATRWKKVKTIGKLRARLEEWSDNEKKKALAKGQEGRAGTIEDQVGCLNVIMDNLTDDDTINALTDRINSLFGDTPPGAKPAVVTLMTIHKSKGREAPRVFIWGMNAYQPSPYARKDWQLQEESNLCYVAITRTLNELHFVNVVKG